MLWYKSVRGRIRQGKGRKFISMSVPVEVTAVNYTTAYAGSVSVLIFGCGVNNDVGTPLERATVDGVGKVLSTIKGTP